MLRDEGLWRTGLALLDALLAAQLQPDGRIYGSVVGALRKEERVTLDRSSDVGCTLDVHLCSGG